MGSHASPGELLVGRLGRVPYAEALDLQHRLRAARQADRLPDVLLLLEHPPVYTRGRRTEPGELPFAAAWYAERGIDVVDTRRGGKVTYHGPGQLVGYLIARAPDLPALVCAIERSIRRACAAHGVEARGRSGEDPSLTGVWVQDRKLAAVGLHRERGVTAHGLALNVCPDLTPFDWIVPCGLSTPVTSLARERGEPDLASDPDLDVDAAVAPVADALAEALAGELGRTAVPVATDALVAAAGAPAPAPAAG